MPARPHLDTPFWSINHPFLDQMLDGPPQVVLRIGEATNADGETLVGVVGFGVGAEVEELYGSTLMQAVFVAAVGLDSGSHHVREVGRPLAPRASAARPDEPPTPVETPQDEEDDGNTAAELVGLDLVRHLNIPRDGGRYAVFAWLDDLVSDVTIIRSPDAAEPSVAPAVSSLLDASAETDAMRHDAPYVDQERCIAVLPDGAADCATAAFAVDGAHRQVTSSSWLSFPVRAIGIGLEKYTRDLEPSSYETRLILFHGESELHILSLPSPRRITSTED